MRRGQGTGGAGQDAGGACHRRASAARLENLSRRTSPERAPEQFAENAGCVLGSVLLRLGACCTSSAPPGETSGRQVLLSVFADAFRPDTSPGPVRFLTASGG